MISEKWLLIGHRGVGKSSFLHGLRPLFEKCIDLDLEIEKRSKVSIADFFEKYGEARFRQLEAATLSKVLEENSKENSIVIALGAGFKGHIWPREYKCLWLRKDSDNSPRYFKDRPSVLISRPETFLSGYIGREKKYQLWADLAWTLEEGFGAFGKEKILWPVDVQIGEEACLTLFSHLHKDPLEAIKLRKKWGTTFELRTDLWLATTIKNTLDSDAESKFLLSVRTEKFNWKNIFSTKSKNVKIDWEIGMGPPPKDLVIDILSLHDFSKGLKDGLNSLEKFSSSYPQALLKASPIIGTFYDMELLWKWREKDPGKTYDFSRTKTVGEVARWQWIRLLLKGKQKVNFVREANEGIKDQPTISQYWSHVPAERFGAILGFPVAHSYSPYFHKDFFKNKAMPFLAIPILTEELDSKTFSFLESLGACAFAVTSPLKSQETLLEKSKAEDTEAHEVLNTLVKSESWQRFNTDSVAIEQLLKKHPGQAWRIWGSGAVAKQFFEKVENAEMYSSRNAELQKKKGHVAESSFILLWAAGDEAANPPASWKAALVCDLSYTKKSQACLYAIEEKLEYESGLEFFEIQGKVQQELWKNI